jgi:hypothetical protein
MLYSEIGIGNGSLVSTEIERKKDEVRVNGWMMGVFRSIYLRLWLGKTVIVIDSVDGLKVTKKSRRKVKILLGIVSH